MSEHADPQVRIEWIVAPDAEEGEWSPAACCVAPAPNDLPLPIVENDEEWWPGRCVA